MDREEFFQLLSFLEMSEYRQEIIQVLAERNRPQTPTSLADATGIHRDHVSRHLAKLKEEDLVAIINPDARMYRYYELTSKGREFVEQLVKHGYLAE